MVKIFAFRLNRNLTSRLIPPDILQYFQLNAIKLAGVDLPAGLNANTVAAIRGAISQAFVSAFRTEMLICASLCVAGAAVAWLMIPAGGD